MTDSNKLDKPFVCSTPGCKMSFINVDHLTVHKRKHDMMLNFGTGGKSGFYLADQTPTPTRFMRNCDEVGLFQELQNVNPFDETFRIAVETQETGGSTGSNIDNGDDTLHTPQVFINNIEPAHPENSKNTVVSLAPSSVNGTKTIIISEELKTKEEMIMSSRSDGEDDASLKKIEKNSHSQVDTFQQETLPLTISSDSDREVRYFIKSDEGKLSELISAPVSNRLHSIKCIKEDEDVNIDEKEMDMENCEMLQSTLISSSLSLAKMRLKQTLMNSSKLPIASDEKIKNENKGEKKMESIDLDKKKDIQERNRASSMRARAKRKEWIKGLQQKVEDVNAVNATLQKEIKALRSEVVKLKTLLLAHKDCPVTKSMDKSLDDYFSVENDTVSLTNKQLLIPTVSSDDSLTTKIKRINHNANDDPTVKKKKQSVILPKIKNSDNHNLPVVIAANSEDKSQQPNQQQQLKIININELNTFSNLNKPIFIISNNSDLQKNVQIIDSKQIINYDQSLQLINVASKSTGT